MAPIPSGSAEISSFPIAISHGMSNLASSSSFHWGPSSFGHTISIFVMRDLSISSLAIKPALIVFPSPTSSASRVTGRRRQNVIRLFTWWWYGSKRSCQRCSDLKSSRESIAIGSVKSHSNPARYHGIPLVWFFVGVFSFEFAR